MKHFRHLRCFRWNSKTRQKLRHVKQPLDTESGLAHTGRVNLDCKLYSLRLLAPARQILFSRFIIAICIETAFVFSMCAAAAAVDPALDWPAWRGPTRD